MDLEEPISYSSFPARSFLATQHITISSYSMPVPFPLSDPSKWAIVIVCFTFPIGVYFLLAGSLHFTSGVVKILMLWGFLYLYQEVEGQWVIFLLASLFTSSLFGVSDRPSLSGQLVR